MQGYKTYIAGIVSILYGLAVILLPEHNLPGDGPALIGIGMTAMGIRHGMKTGG